MNWNRLLPYALALLLIAASAPHLDDYGVNWDEALGDIFFGERYFSFFTSFNDTYLDFEANPYPPGHSPDLSVSPFRRYPWEYFPFANTVGVITLRMFDAAGLDPFDGFHAINLFFAALLLIVLFRFADRYFGRNVALLSVAVLFLSPRIFGDMMFNTKDFPQMALFSVALFAFHHAYVRGSFRLMSGSGIVLGLALATKANAFFAPLVALGVMLIDRGRAWRDAQRGEESRGVPRLLLASLSAGLLSLLVLVIAWPYLWADPFTRLAQNLTYIATRKSISTAGVTTPPLLALLWTTPPVVLLGFAVGLVPLIRGVASRSTPHALLASWLTVVLLRLHLPGSVNFDVVRHFLELFPPLAIVCALGYDWLLTFITENRRRVARNAMVAVVAAVMLATLVSVHPHEITYWNSLAGGLRGAAARQIPQHGDYWAVSYRHGMRWLNEHAPRNSFVVAPIAEHTVKLVAPRRLRDDIKTVRYASPEGPSFDLTRLQTTVRAGQRFPVFVMFVPRDDWANEMTKYCELNLKPVASWRRDGVALLNIYRLQ